jgi:TolB-like protein
VDQTVGRYRILETLGEGGMGVVYAAEDPSLGRRVAIKRIRHAGGDPGARRRLEREARAAASVNHPNVCQVYEVGEQDGDLFVAMELLEGQPLSSRIARGTVPFREAVEIALGILAALEALHAKRIVHRDLKPSNVFLTPYGVKLLDFGLALPLQEALSSNDVRLTQTGALVGTPGFMAPEQWTADAVGPPADLFALGAVLFEMLAGRPAFAGRNAMETYHAIVHEQPPALAGGEAVVAVDRVIQRALSKKPEDRHASAAEMAEELRAALPLAAGAAPARVRALTRLIVLPFRLLRPDPEADFLRFGLPDAIASSLAGCESLTVRSTAAASRFSADAPDLKAIASEAQVDVVLLGTILRGGSRVRVGTQLVEAPGGAVIRSETVDASMDDVFRLQDEVSKRVVDSLSEEIGRRESKALQKDVPADAEAYELYLRANQLSLSQTNLADARDLYLQALARDPRYAPAWARLGRAYRLIAKYAHGESAENLRLAEEAFSKSLALNPDLSSAHNLYTFLEIEEKGRAPEAMVRLLDRGHRRPGDAELFAGLVVACRFGGLLEASVAADRRARRIDPGIRTSVSFTYWDLGDYERAMRYDDDERRFVRVYSLPLMGRTDEALRVLATASLDGYPGIARQFFRCMRASLTGDRAGVVEVVEAFRASEFHDPEGFYFIARCAAKVGALDEALDLLEVTVRRGFHVPSLLERDPWLDAVRDAPRWRDARDAARDGNERAARMYDEAGGERLLGVPARAPA